MFLSQALKTDFFRTPEKTNRGKTKTKRRRKDGSFMWRSPGPEKNYFSLTLQSAPSSAENKSICLRNTFLILMRSYSTKKKGLKGEEKLYIWINTNIRMSTNIQTHTKTPAKINKVFVLFRIFV